MESLISVKRQSFDIRLNSVIPFVFVAFCQPQILRYSARDVTDIFRRYIGKVSTPLQHPRIWFVNSCSNY